jgi:hypothetical protein
VRKQYHSRRLGGDTLIWDCDRLVELAEALPREMIPLESIRELDEAYWRAPEDPHLTCREIVDHMRLVWEADLSCPIILSSDGRILDGMHRVAKAALEDLDEIEAVRFDRDPEPDYVNVPLSALPY